jgi:hypothetical protein
MKEEQEAARWRLIGHLCECAGLPSPEPPRGRRVPRSGSVRLVRDGDTAATFTGLAG